jgi:hypothetical protein
MDEQDIKQLDNFIISVQKDVDLVVSEIGIIMPEQEEMHDLVKRAWKDVSPRLGEVSEYIIGKRELNGLREQLVDRGLTGVQLALKLSVYEARRNRFQKEWDRFAEASQNEKKKRGHFMRGIIRRLLRIIDRILDSLAFIPGAEAAKEVKDTIEDLL